jgi:hypothetical protein
MIDGPHNREHNEFVRYATNIFNEFDPFHWNQPTIEKVKLQLNVQKKSTVGETITIIASKGASGTKTKAITGNETKAKSTVSDGASDADDDVTSYGDSASDNESHSSAGSTKMTTKNSSERRSTKQLRTKATITASRIINGDAGNGKGKGYDVDGDATDSGDEADVNEAAASNKVDAIGIKKPTIHVTIKLTEKGATATTSAPKSLTKKSKKPNETDDTPDGEPSDAESSEAIRNLSAALKKPRGIRRRPAPPSVVDENATKRNGNGKDVKGTKTPTEKMHDHDNDIENDGATSDSGMSSVSQPNRSKKKKVAIAKQQPRTKHSLTTESLAMVQKSTIDEKRNRLEDWLKGPPS